MNIGFIGTGSMGSAIVPHLLSAGHRVEAWNRSPAAVEALEGVGVLSSPSAAFENEVVMTMLSDDNAIRSVLIDSGALFRSRKDCVHIVMSTISMKLAEELQALHRAAGVAYVAAPVFGVPAVAVKAQLNIVAAGSAEAIARIQPLFDAIGQKTWWLGEDQRLANVAKIAGNMMITLAIEAMGEATALTEHYGLSAADFLGVVTGSLFSSPVYTRYGNAIASGNHEPGFKLVLGLKDVNLAREAAAAKFARLPALDIVQENMQTAIDQGLGSMDWSILARITRHRAGRSDSKD
jgi:3-hydroxyisobutyrate dehydrogenase-like beta-hydroxyacid dehydrogenase